MGCKILGHGRYRVYTVTDSASQVKMTLFLTIYFLGHRVPTLLLMLMLSMLLFGGQARAESIDNAVAALDSGQYLAAREGLEALAKRGNSDAQTLLGIMYSEGRGITRDIHQARQWLSRAAHQGSDDAQFLLGLSYLGGYGQARGKSGQNDPTKARIWLRRSAHNGNALAQGFLVSAYKNGWFGSKDQQRASYWQGRLRDVN
ncbi:tetratricopeptide repeat protein [Sulfuriflexus mobilis]|uniref:tetratricopeptide repeat protein n=1 Tax=Sulfuriflexus mobilis TaxID=1811807 RepID=UPI000F84E625|nr:tetratricopeptide repeat protein [Sulfuriflexus mobilis]